MTIKFDDVNFAVPEGTFKVEFASFPATYLPAKPPVPPAAVLTEEEAARFINEDTTWEPGWTITAEAIGHSWWSTSNSDTVRSRLKVHMSKQSKNSSLPAEDGTYTEPWELQWSLSVPDFARASYDALMYWVLEKITWCNEHETREFSRYKKDGKWYAPFQPHRGFYHDQHTTPEWQAQYRDPSDTLIAARRP